jgi:hypothetical protein
MANAGWGACMGKLGLITLAGEVSKKSGNTAKITRQF